MRRSTYHDNVTIKILADINITLDDRVVGGNVDTARLETQDGWLEESLRSTETLVSNGDDLSIWKLVRLLQAGALAGGLDLLLKVESDVAELLLDVTNDFTLGSGGEGVTTLGQDLHQVVGQIATGHINTSNGVRKRETLVNGNNVGDSITGVKNNTSGTTRGVQGEDGLDGDVESWGVEGLKNDLSHLLSVRLWVDWGLSEENWVLLWCNTKLVVESVMPDLLHIVPVGDDTVLNWVSEGQNTTLGLSLITDIRVLLTHTNHDTIVLGQSLNVYARAVYTALFVGSKILPMVTRTSDDGCWKPLSVNVIDVNTTPAEM